MAFGSRQCVRLRLIRGKSPKFGFSQISNLPDKTRNWIVGFVGELSKFQELLNCRLQPYAFLIRGVESSTRHLSNLSTSNFERKDHQHS